MSGKRLQILRQIVQFFYVRFLSRFEQHFKFVKLFILFILKKRKRVFLAHTWLFLQYHAYLSIYVKVRLYARSVGSSLH